MPLCYFDVILLVLEGESKEGFLSARVVEMLISVGRAQQMGKLPLSFQGQPAPAAARTAALCPGCQADPIPVLGSARAPSAQYQYRISC